MYTSLPDRRNVPSNPWESAGDTGAKFSVNLDNLHEAVAEFQDIVNAIAQANRTKLTMTQQREIQNQRERGKSLASDIVRQLKNIKPDQRPRYDRLEADFNRELKRFEAVVKASKQKQEPSQMAVTGPNAPLIDDTSLSDPRFSISHAQSFTEEQYAQERTQQLMSVEQDLTELNALVKEVNTLVHHDQVRFDTIEDNVTKTHDTVTTGNQQLQKALQHQKASRKRICCILILLLIIGVILALVFGVGRK
eukprot:c39295_g1_i1.p1 GENE.c39295_g1_i1~~c39295_g1_i1.p1  ORF type:complete len:250 (-),score=52.89 c39295_g1_i1:130-879(-)